MSIENINLFQANLFTKKHVGDDRDRELLLDSIRKLQEKYPDSNDATNFNCWRSDEDLGDIQWLLMNVMALLEKAVKYYRVEDQVFSMANPTKTCKIHSWTNVNKPYSRNVLHSHVGSHFSCVYYLQGTGCGDLRLINPANILGNCNRSAPFVRDFAFSPTDGDLILWPAWIPHEVEPNISTRERINVVFDITLGDP